MRTEGLWAYRYEIRPDERSGHIDMFQRVNPHNYDRFLLPNANRAVCLNKQAAYRAGVALQLLPPVLLAS